MSNGIRVEAPINRSIKVMAPISRAMKVLAPINRKIFVSSEMSVPTFAPNIPPTGTLALNSIVTPTDPGEVLFDYTTSDPDGIVVKIELLRKESLEPSFIEVAEILSPGASGQITDLAVPDGTYEYKLLITDDDGDTGESNVVAGVVINPTVPAIITWAGIANQNLAVDAAVIPGTNGFMKVFLAGTSTARIESEKLELINPATQNSLTNYATAHHTQDLNTIRTGGAAGTWFLRWKIRVSNGIGGVSPFPLILGRLATAADVTSPFPANEFTVWCDFVGTSEDFFALRYQNLSAAFTTAGSVNKGAGFMITERVYELEKTATQYIWRIDVGGLLSVITVNISLVNQPVSEFIHFGHITGGFNERNDATTTKIMDDIELL